MFKSEKEFPFLSKILFDHAEEEKHKSLKELLKKEGKGWEKGFGSAYLVV